MKVNSVSAHCGAPCSGRPLMTWLSALALLSIGLTACARDDLDKTLNPVSAGGASRLESLAPASVTSYDTVPAWPQSQYDQDGDGYASSAANSHNYVSVSVDSRYPLSCPSGYVRKLGDTRDDKASVHPRRQEVYGNDLDDDCDGSVDEPEFSHIVGGINNTTSGFTMRVKINDPSVISEWNNSGSTSSGGVVFSVPTRLAYAISYQPLSTASGTPTTLSPAFVSSVVGSGSSYSTDISLTGLSSGKVYRAQVQFYRASFGLGGWHYSRLGAVSDWYYCMTDDVSSTLAHRRYQIVTKAIYECFLSEHLGYVGYRGLTYADGTRYGTYAGDSWCADFYSTVTTGLLNGMTHEVGTSGVADHFTFYVDPVTSWSGAGPGDLVTFVKDADGSLYHTAMFLAYESSTGSIWTLEGNTDGLFIDSSGASQSRYGGNEVFIQSRSLTSSTHHFGLGMITTSLM